jgi:acyl transferase domain-containing protein/thioesterase domain-containing protein/acyl carrier protein
MELIAIIGIGCRYPGAKNHQEFWDLLCNETFAVKEIPSTRWDIDKYYDSNAQAPGKMNTKWAGLLEDVDLFDAQFFGISPREAVQIDPQQRLLLEVTWEALEDAGLVAKELAGSKTGVYIGIMANDYSRNQLNHPHLIDVHTGTGNLTYCIAANRLSYIFDLQGPSLAIDTACSSSLVAVHLACQSLRSGESTLAIAGGVNLIFWPWSSIYFSKAGFMAPDGRCKTFDAKANGFVRGEGAGVVILKPLSKALADNDQIYAVIAGSAVNQDGRSNGITAPNRLAQEIVLTQAYKNAGISPNKVQYIEAHGTGTALGDPIEVRALGNILKENRSPDKPCIIGSVKTNIGHLEAAAGITGLIKTALMLKNKKIPASLHFQEPNPHIPFSELLMKVQSKTSEWTQTEKIRIAGVSAFGFGGTNAHVVMQEFKQVQTNTISINDDEVFSLVLSGRTPIALKSLATSYSNLIKANKYSLLDICYSAAAHRSHHEHRLAVTTNSQEQLKELLDNFINNKNHPQVAFSQKLNKRNKLVFCFSGQGSQWWQMGRTLLQTSTVFLKVIQKCDQLIKKYGNWSLIEELMAEESSSRINETEIAQPAIFAIQVALSCLLIDLGINPSAVVGHSVGEIAAAHIAGIFSLDEAVRIVFYRGKVMQQATGLGKMVAVRANEKDIEEILKPYNQEVSIAAINSPSQTVIAGNSEKLASIVQLLEGKGFLTRYLNVNYAFHSLQMVTLQKQLANSLENIKTDTAKLPIYSTATGKLASSKDYSSDYWVEHLVKPVRFVDAINSLIDDGYNIFLEIGSHTTLTSLIEEILKVNKKEGFFAVPSLKRSENEYFSLMNMLGKLYTFGYEPAWSKLYTKAQYVPIPFYAWQKERFWLEKMPSLSETDSLAKPIGLAHPFMTQHVELANQKNTHMWELSLTANSLAYFKDHKIQENIIFPATGYLEWVFAAINKVLGQGSYVLEDIVFSKALLLSDKEKRVQLFISIRKDNQAEFNLYSCDKGQDWQKNVEGKIKVDNSSFMLPSITEIQARSKEILEKDRIYSLLEKAGNYYGESFQGIEKLWVGEKELLGQIKIHPIISQDSSNYYIHPALLDACAHLIFFLQNKQEAFMPIKIGKAKFYNQPTQTLWSYCSYSKVLKDKAQIDIYVFSQTGQLVAELSGNEVYFLKNPIKPILKANTEITYPEKIFYTVEWLEKARERKQMMQKHLKGRWIILADKLGIGKELSSFLATQDDDYILVYAGDSFEKRNEKQFVINPSSETDFQTLLNTIDNGVLKGFIHLWSINTVANKDLSVANLLSAEQITSVSLLNLIKTLSITSRKLKIWLATQGSQAIRAKDIPNLAQSPIWGIGRSLAYEEPMLWGGLIDLSVTSSVRDSASQLWKEILMPEEDQVAFRDGYRFVPRLNYTNVKNNEQDPPLTTDGVYIITGGLGDLGLAVAAWMVEKGVKHLALITKTDLPSRETWKSENHPIRVLNKIKAIESLEKLGANVDVLAIDVTNEESLQKALADCQRKGSIRGVVHAAGVANITPLRNMSITEMLDVMAPKILGSWLLYKFLDKESLDFYVLFSSVSSVVNSPGMAHYAGGNAFLDALAHINKDKKAKTISINWGAWSEIGMAARNYAGGPNSIKGINTISPSQGISIFEQSLSQDISQLVVLPIDWKQYSSVYSNVAKTAFFSKVIDASIDVSEPVMNAPISSIVTKEIPSTVSNPLNTVGFNIPNNTDGKQIQKIVSNKKGELSNTLLELIADVLKMPLSQIEVDEPLNALGLDSLMATELRSQIENKYSVSLPIVSFLQGNTIEQLVNQITEQLGESQPLAQESALQIQTSETTENQNSLIKRVLQELTADVLKMPLSQIEVDEPLNALGLDSLMATELRSQIENKYSVSLPIVSFLQGNTIEQLVNQITEQLGEVKELIPKPIKTPTKEIKEPSSLIKIQTQGENPPLFFVHPVGGSIFCYTELSRQLGSKQPFYAFQSPGLEGEQEPYTDISKLAKKYLREMIAINSGPYYLGGWSLGGVVAFEMCRQLISEGHKVARLFLIDSYRYNDWIPFGAKVDNSDNASLMAWIANDISKSRGKSLTIQPDDLMGLTAENQINFILKHIENNKIFPKDFPLTQIKHMIRVFQANLLALSTYVASPIDVPTTLLRASEMLNYNYPESGRNLTVGWDQYLNDIAFQLVPGNHYSILTPPTVSMLAEKIKSSIS